MPRVKLPDGQRRVKVFGRVDPKTAATLMAIGAENHGRAIDKLANMARAMQAALTVLVIESESDAGEN